MTESFSNPPYWEYQWECVDWDSPYPNDLVALHEMYRDTQMEYIQYCLDLHNSGISREDMPSASQYIWGKVIVPVGMSPEGAAFDPYVYEELSRYADIGSFVCEDRRMQCMTEEELAEFMEHKAKMKEFVDDLFESPETQGLIEDIITRHENRKNEVADLNDLFYDLFEKEQGKETS